MSEVEIIAIRKDGGNHYNENEAITDLRWINHFNKKIGESTRASMIRYIKEGNHAYVSSGIKKAYCYIRNNGNIEFLQTISDGYYSNNLLSLPEF